MNLTYEQLIELNSNRLIELENNLDQIKCKDQPEIELDDNFLIKKANEKLGDNNFNKLNIMQSIKINKMKNDRKLSILDAFQYQYMRSCIRSLNNNSKNLFNNINYFTYFSSIILVNLIVQQKNFF